MPYSERFCRNMPTISEREQHRLEDSVFCVVGLGGVGGFALENLVRLGAGRFVLFDHDRFDLTNFNRQFLATDGTLDCKKKEAAIARIRSINKKAGVRAFSGFDESKISRADVLIDATDNVRTKMQVASACRKRKIPYVFSSALGSRGIVSVFKDYPFEKAFQVDEAKLSSHSCMSALCPAASIAGSLAAAMAMGFVLGKPIIQAPEALFFDLFDRRLFWKARLG